MKFTALPLKGAYVVEPEPARDGRGWFARSWCREEFASRGLAGRLEQCSVSFNKRKGTLRGMHYQAAPHGETKLVRCTRGAIHDVIVDVRRGSPTRWKWHAVRLTAENGRQLYIPKGFAHGFQALEDGTEVFYQISDPYVPSAARGLRWDDPALAIRWPIARPVLSGKDANYADIDIVSRKRGRR